MFCFILRFFTLCRKMNAILGRITKRQIWDVPNITSYVALWFTLTLSVRIFSHLDKKPIEINMLKTDLKTATTAS